MPKYIRIAIYLDPESSNDVALYEALRKTAYESHTSLSQLAKASLEKDYKEKGD